MSEAAAAHITDAIDAQLEDARAEVAALEACLEEMDLHIADLEEQRAELARLERAAPLTGARVRDTVRQLDTFTMGELACELDKPTHEVRPYLRALLAGGIVVDAGKVGRAPLYGYARPDEPGPTHHPTRRPPEKDPPALLDARATGMPVRVAAAQKITRRGRSTPGVAQKVKNTDRNYARQQEAKAARVEASKAKAQKEPKWKRRK